MGISASNCDVGSNRLDPQRQAIHLGDACGLADLQRSVAARVPKLATIPDADFFTGSLHDLGLFTNHSLDACDYRAAERAARQIAHGNNDQSTDRRDAGNEGKSDVHTWNVR